ncbi:MAG: hypothetical protein MRY64_13350 [Hyphomonadaceae bacterium]|nr:hypothetical protein [Hyphomonadaceae bacterium]
MARKYAICRRNAFCVTVPALFPECAKDGETGYLVDEGDVEATRAMGEAGLCAVGL